jgi:hypothetical protein
MESEREIEPDIVVDVQPACAAYQDDGDVRPYAPVTRFVRSAKVERATGSRNPIPYNFDGGAPKNRENYRQTVKWISNRYPTKSTSIYCFTRHIRHIFRA